MNIFWLAKLGRMILMATRLAKLRAPCCSASAEIALDREERHAAMVGKQATKSSPGAG
jgi:hypothetical protein